MYTESSFSLIVGQKKTKVWKNIYIYKFIAINNAADYRET